MRYFVMTALIASQILPVPAAAAGDEPAVFSTRAGAIRGYDPVAYFTERKAVKGDRKLQYRWRNADWSFASAANRDLFRDNPERYAPQFGGYCAYAMSKGSYATSDPNAWTIHKDKLYLNFSLAVRKTWRKDIDANIESAERHWSRLR